MENNKSFCLGDILKPDLPFFNELVLVVAKDLFFYKVLNITGCEDGKTRLIYAPTLYKKIGNIFKRSNNEN